MRMDFRAHINSTFQKRSFEHREVERFKRIPPIKSQPCKKVPDFFKIKFAYQSNNIMTQSTFFFSP